MVSDPSKLKVFFTGKIMQQKEFTTMELFDIF